MQTETQQPPGDLRAVIARVERALLHLPEASVRVADLARATGVSARTVYRAFARHRGAPPIAQLRRSRLEQARLRLQAPTPRETVTSVALDCGFCHLGRFAAFYERCFGERPSETLRCARAGRTEM